MANADASLPAVFGERPSDGIVLVTLNRPGARNAVNREMATLLSHIVASTEADASVRAVILTGAGSQAFCAGADLKEVDAGRMRELFLDNGFAGFVDARRRKPWIAAVNGFALAGGCEIALACDMIIATDTARFGLPEVARGLVAAAGGAYRLCRRIPPGVAAELILTGRLMTAVEAERWGLVNRVVVASDLRDAAIALANDIVRNAPLAVAESLALARASIDRDDATLGAMSRKALELLAVTEDYAEGPRAFLEKRPPAWKGR